MSMNEAARGKRQPPFEGVAYVRWKAAILRGDVKQPPVAKSSHPAVTPVVLLFADRLRTG
jgi:hypothetical protein